ncbi:Polyisoprenoid-binding protein YceI [Pustulibacterium marinum]|uniref:Polyisoprenoid-binding protein YceI n=1 Tax=Pustulibacterium marinum TaxID=1224947 RepID=A0A1I7GM74_9FLAO|nr:YceI family protein [Pustulibacterium marinum]SFU49548.1 Polyisoprenoid-binding protein YceI [Pustulibacterium marinum]
MEKSIWNLDPTHSEIVFKVKHMMISTVTGNFKEFSGKVETTSETFDDAVFELDIESASIDTNNGDRDNHLKSAEFFDAENHPKISFVSKNYTDGKLEGDLTIKGVTKTVTLDLDYNGTAVDPYGQTKSGFEAVGKINRKDFGLTWSAVTEAGNVVVSDTVTMLINVQFVKQ